MPDAWLPAIHSLFLLYKLWVSKGALKGINSGNLQSFSPIPCPGTTRSGFHGSTAPQCGQASGGPASLSDPGSPCRSSPRISGRCRPSCCPGLCSSSGGRVCRSQCSYSRGTQDYFHSYSLITKTYSGASAPFVTPIHKIYKTTSSPALYSSFI